MRPLAAARPKRHISLHPIPRCDTPAQLHDVLGDGEALPEALRFQLFEWCTARSALPASSWHKCRLGAPQRITPGLLGLALEAPYCATSQDEPLRAQWAAAM